MYQTARALVNLQGLPIHCMFPKTFMLIIVMDWIVFPQNLYVQFISSIVAVSGDRAFKEVVKDKWDCKERLQTLCDCVSYKKRDTRDLHAHTWKVQWGLRRGHLQAKEKGFTRKKPHRYLDLGHPAFRTARKYISAA